MMSSKQEHSHADDGSESQSPIKTLVEPNHNLNQMFLDGTLSDISIKAFGRTWNLHKNILGINSPYFMSLFTKHSKKKVLELAISDQKVTVEVLHSCLQSMYAFEVELTKANVIPMLAATTFLELDEQIQNCHDFMIKSMGTDSVLEYLKYLEMYGGGKSVEKAAFECLEICLTLIKFQGEISNISVELLTKIATSSNLYCKNEGSLYATMVLWLYIKITGFTFEESVQSKARIERAFDYFEKLEGSIPFLSTDAGRPYIDAFRQIRIRDLLIARAETLSSLKQQKIFPSKWIDKALAENWERIEQAMSDKPSLSQDKKNFNEKCVRCGTLVSNFHQFSRTTFKHAFVSFELNAEKFDNKWIFKIKRTQGEVELKPNAKKEMLVKGRVVKQAQSGKILYTLSSGIKKISLKIGEEFEVLSSMENLDDCIVCVVINYLF